MQRYLVFGSGLIGRLLAWRLTRAGHQVDILSSDDRLGTDSAGFIAASMIAPYTEAVSADKSVLELGMRSYALWPVWLSELSESIFFNNKGTLVVAHPGDKAEMQRYQRRADHIVGTSAYQSLDRIQLEAREPELAERFQEALFFADEACLDNRQLYQKLGEFLEQNCHWQQITAVEHLNEQVIDELCHRYFSTTLTHYDAVLDCRGNGARADIADLRSVRGEVIRVHAPAVDLQHCIRLMHPRYPFYLAPRPNHEYVLGATVIESADRSELSVRSGLELLSALYSLHPGFAEARILELRAHCRPALLGHLPEIRQTSWGYQLNGFYRHGYLFGPAVIERCLESLGMKTQPMLSGVCDVH
ncbi:glycine oxidase [Methylophaga lonarensis MPL]|uniref:D-amino-acid oxidase n=1 Tax=Methylophaga lonarensis MPL TaxID=1286106 RepID=M7NZV6_9GAMM|nr:FAD-binding oxidoreductase [Methylophaga lonarensis]EMR14378.1 glycine oxidase [Methylophaga lonarensis MPL]